MAVISQAVAQKRVAQDDTDIGFIASEIVENQGISADLSWIPELSIPDERAIAAASAAEAFAESIDTSNSKKN